MALFFKKAGARGYVREFVADDSIFDGLSAEEIFAQYNLYALEGKVVAPPGKILVDYAAEDDPETGLPSLIGIFQDIPLDDIKTEKKQYVSDRKWVEEGSGFTYLGLPFASDDRAQLKYMGIVMAAQMNPSYSVNFKAADGNFIDLSAAQAVGLAMAARAHVQHCFDNESRIKDLIDAATTFEELDAIDLESGW